MKDSKCTYAETNKYISIHFSSRSVKSTKVIIHFVWYAEFLMCDAEQIEERCSSDQYKHPPTPRDGVKHRSPQFSLIAIQKAGPSPVLD
jgi:hypothetical protein